MLAPRAMSTMIAMTLIRVLFCTGIPSTIQQATGPAR